MTVAVVTGPARVVAQIRELTWRSLLGEARQWSAFLPGLMFPLLLAAVYSAQFQRALGLPGFPEVDSFLDFIVPATILQAVSFGGTEAGSQLALDIETGFFDRLLASPVARVPILLGRLGGSFIVAMFKAALFLVIFTFFGLEVAGGIGGAAVLVLSAGLLVLVLGGLGQALALRTGSQEAVNATFPVVFVFVFISSAFFPTSQMNGWYRTVAESNPITWIIDPNRRLVIEGWSTSDALQALGVPAALAVVAMTAALLELRARLART